MNKPPRRAQPFLKKAHHEEDDGEGNWLISYADLMTLLWGFFVILTAFSEPSSSKFEKLKKETAEAMGGKYESPYNEITDRIRQIVTELNLEEQVRVENLTDGLKITAESETFFTAGSAKLLPTAQDILLKLGAAMVGSSTGHRILIEGHTDDVPISNSVYPSNWELSLRRASEVVRLFEGLGIEHKTLRPIGVADVEPLQDPKGLSGAALEAARAKNRRVVIHLQRIIPKPLPAASEPKR